MAKEPHPEIPVRFYRSAAGSEPVLEWLRSLNREDRRAIGLDLMRVQLGWPVGMAGWDATGEKPEGRPMGDALKVAEPADCPPAVVLPRE